MMVTASIVLYHNDIEVLSRTVESFLASPVEKRLYLIDNSKTDALRSHFDSDEIRYLHTGQNLGFGKAHNLILSELKEISDFHLVLNPDTYFESDVIPLLINELKNDVKIGVSAPQVLYPDGSLQNSARKFPKFQDLIIRRLPFLIRIFKGKYEKANYLNSIDEKPLAVDAVSGCFQLFKTEVYVAAGGFDPRYFMYMEDLDICRKVHELGYKVQYNPNVVIYHHSEYGSKKSPKLFWIHLISMMKYFNKWK